MARSIRPSDSDGSVADLWVGDGDAISWVGVGCGPSSAMYRFGGDFLSGVVSLVRILIRKLSYRFRLFSVCDMSSGDRLFWE